MAILKKKKIKESLVRILGRLIEQEEVDVLVGLLEDGNRFVSSKILKLISEKKVISLDLVYRIPNQAGKLLSEDLKMRIWSRVNQEELTPAVLLQLIKFRPVFRKKAIEYALSKNLPEPFLTETMKQIVVFSHDQSIIDRAMEILEKRRLSSVEVEELIKAKPESKRLRELKRKAEAKEAADFLRLKRIRTIMEQL